MSVAPPELINMILGAITITNCNVIIAEGFALRSVLSWNISVGAPREASLLSQRSFIISQVR
ncbi:MAG: hypothetical protein ACTS43_01025 [Candidatus Hodgkinia cicadicola]